MSLQIQQNSDKKQPSSNRRRLLKGTAAAAPMVLTLRSGAALAEASASCMERIPEQPMVLAEVSDVAPPLGTGTDTFVRAETSGRVLTPVGGGESIIVFKLPGATGDDVDWFSVEEDTFNGNPFKQIFKKDKVTPKNRMKRDENGTWVKYTYSSTTTPCYVICWIDAQGQPYNPPVYGQPPVGEAPVATASCMASLAAG